MKLGPHRFSVSVSGDEGVIHPEKKLCPAKAPVEIEGKVEWEVEEGHDACQFKPCDQLQKPGPWPTCFVFFRVFFTSLP